MGRRAKSNRGAGVLGQFQALCLCFTNDLTNETNSHTNCSVLLPEWPSKARLTSIVFTPQIIQDNDR